MAAPAVPDDGDEELHAGTPTSGEDFGPKSVRLVLSDYEIQTEAVITAYIAVEHGRITGSVDARRAAAYAGAVADNSRLLAGSSARSHLALMRHMVRWLRGQPVGAELRWP